MPACTRTRRAFRPGPFSACAAIRNPRPATWTSPLGRFLRDVMKLNLKAANFRIFGPR